MIQLYDAGMKFH